MTNGKTKMMSRIPFVLAILAFISISFINIAMADETMDLRSGMNLFNYPVEVPPGLTAYDLLQNLGGQDVVSSIQRFHRPTGRFETATWLLDQPAGVDFEINNEVGYLIYMKEDRSGIDFPGSRNCVSITLKKRFNLMGFPCAQNGYNSYNILHDLGEDAIKEIKRYDRENGTFQSACWDNGSILGDLFDIVHGEAYFVYMREDKTWSPSSSGPTYVGGSITTDTQWGPSGNPYIVIDNIIVEPGITLTIEPGVEIRFGRGYHMTVNGSLAALGTEANPVVFTSDQLAPVPGDWQGIQFMESSDDGQCRLSHCRIEYGLHGIYSSASSPTVDHCRILHCNYGIKCYNNATPAVISNEIYDNTDSGVHCSNHSSPTIDGNKIYRNDSRGIYCYQSSPSISNNLIYYNNQGIYCAYQSSPSITNNTITDNLTGISSSSSYPAITNCILWQNGNDLFGCSATYSDIGDGDTGEGNISIDPLFINHAFANFHLSLDSPCIDSGSPAGAPATDMDDDLRNDGSIDMGADEYVDTDHDGMQDYWEMKWFGDLSLDGTGDFDNDTLTDLAEYQYDSNPKQRSVVHVDDDNTGYEDGTQAHPFNTIQEGIDWLSGFGIVRVAEGNYTENVEVNSYCFLQGAGRGLSVIDGNGKDVITFSFGSSGKVEGFTIKNGARGIYCVHSSPEIRNNEICNNNSSGVYCYYYASPVIEENEIRNNGTYGISCNNSDPKVTGNEIHGNGYSGVYCYYSSPTVGRNEIYTNSGDGIYCYYSYPDIRGNRLHGNNGDGIYCFYSSPSVSNNLISSHEDGICCDYYSSPEIINNTIAGNFRGVSSYDSSPEITNCILWQNGDDLFACTATYSDIQDGDSGEGNISADPLFAGRAAGNYHLSQGSPCMNAGSSVTAPDTDLDDDLRNDGAIDMGADEYVDTDHDGMQDYWEMKWFEDLSRDGTGDFDNDTLTDLAEYQYDSNPKQRSVVHVDDNNAGYEDGTQAHPFNTIQEGIDWLSGFGIVSTAEGNYTENVLLHTCCFLQGAGAGSSVIDGGGGDAVTFSLCSGGKVEGFTIKNGAKGIYCDHSSPDIIRNEIHHNSEGGIYCQYSCPVIRENTIQRNDNHGISNHYSWPEVDDNHIHLNEGSGVYCNNSFSSINANGIYENSVYGISCQSSSPKITANKIYLNMDDGIYCEDSPAYITANEIYKNSDDGIYCNSSSPGIINNLIYNNSDDGIFCDSSSPDISTNEIYRNSDDGIYCNSSSPGIINNLIYGNDEGVYCYSGSSPAITNNTILDNTSTGINSSSSSPVITNSILWQNGDDLSGCTATYSDISDGDAGEGNISDDPFFVNPEAANFHLSSDSPCIDSASSASAPEADLDGDLRDDGAIDIGADEHVDTDSDGMQDFWEYKYFGDLTHDPGDNDDGDMLTNEHEYQWLLNPLSADTDNDKLDDDDEIITYDTSPRYADTDVDGVSDGVEVQQGTDPKTPTRIDITDITASPRFFSAIEGESTTLQFTLSMQADVSIKIYEVFPDGSRNYISEIACDLPQSQGANSYIWTGKDYRGESLNLGTYSYVLVVRSPLGYRGLYDPEYVPGVVTVSDPSVSAEFDPYKNEPCELTYDLVAPAWVTARIFSGATWIRTLISNQPRDVTGNMEYWDGRDDNGNMVGEGTYGIRYLTNILADNAVVITDKTYGINSLLAEPYLMIPTYGQITTIVYDLPREATVTIKVYRPDGSYFRTLIDGELQSAGSHSVEWDGTNDEGTYASIEGNYMVEVTAGHGEGSATVKRRANVMVH